ncbi:unnamed protein product, partial [Rotaria sp. Silwood2]
VDVIIGTSSSVNLKNAILDAAGTAARTAYNAELSKNPQPILISIPSGGLPCKKIFLIKWRPEQDEAELRNSISGYWLWRPPMLDRSCNHDNGKRNNISDTIAKRIIVGENHSASRTSEYL